MLNSYQPKHNFPRNQQNSFFQPSTSKQNSFLQTNIQVKNINGTNNRINTNQNFKPTPMSISTRNTSVQQPRQQNYFRSNFNPNQKFISEELYNIEQIDNNESDNNEKESEIFQQNDFLEENASENMN